MATVIDTRVVPAAEGLRFWTESSRTAFNPLHMSGGSGFVACLRGDALGPLGVFRIVASASTMTRTFADVAAGDPGCVQLSLVRAGRLRCAQGDRVATVGPGEMTSYDTSAPAVVSAAGPFDLLAIRMPKALLGEAGARVGALTARRIAGGPGWPRLAASLYGELADGLARGAFRSGDGDLVDLAVHLARRVYAELDGPGGGPASFRETLRRRAHDHIEAELGDPELDPRRVAHACHASVRALHYAFAGTGETVSGFIAARRLERAARELADPAHVHEPVARVAARWGFPSASAFSHRFHDAYGCAPTAYRRAARAAPAADFPRG